MNSSIYIDGAALWVLLIMAAILFVGFIYFGNCYIAEARENDRLKRKVKQYVAELDERDSEREKAEYKDGFLQDIISLDSDIFEDRAFNAGFNLGRAIGEVNNDL